MAARNKYSSYYILEWKFSSVTNEWCFSYYFDEAKRVYNKPSIKNYGRCIELCLPKIDIKDDVDIAIHQWKNKMLEHQIENFNNTKINIDKEIEIFQKLIK